ncbi:MAG: DUF4838 domain-containing protein [Clostridiales bacterium]|nr:DUF4838 domain-containing protein [Clostridiales bacterium]
MRKLIILGKEITALKLSAPDTPVGKYAAGEFSKYLEKTCGIKPVCCCDCEAFKITLNEDKELSRDSYRICVCGECGISICGGNGRGILYGVYAFFEKYAGVRYFMPGLETLGEGDIVIDEGFEFTPPFEYRQSDWQCGNDFDWCVKNGENSRPIPNEMGGHIKYGIFVHSMERLTGTPQSQQPCLSDPAVLERAITEVRGILAADPNITIISVSQNDNYNYCKCEKCAAVDEEEGSHAGTLLRFVNAVADNIRDDYPNVVIDTLAYQYTRHVPSITKPRPNVCIRLCSIECCFAHPLDDRSCPENNAFFNDIIDWNKICDRIYIWDYVTNFSHYIPTFPNFGVLRQNMRFFAEHGVRGMYPEGNYNSPKSGEFGELRCYLLAKLMMNPYMSTVEYYRHMDEFLAAYYGEGWRYIRAYIDFTCAEAAGGHMKIWDPPFSIIPREKYEALEETIDNWWNKAEEMAGDRLEAVKRSRFQWRYIKLMLHPDAVEGRKFREDVEAADVLWNEWRKLPEKVDYSKEPNRWWE